MLKDKKNQTRQIQINAQKKTDRKEMLNKQSEEDLAIITGGFGEDDNDTH